MFFHGPPACTPLLWAATHPTFLLQMQLFPCYCPSFPTMTALLESCPASSNCSAFSLPVYPIFCHTHCLSMKYRKSSGQRCQISSNVAFQSILSVSRSTATTLSSFRILEYSALQSDSFRPLSLLMTQM